ncbi:hypothetical protein QZH41_020140 [Actinostola sp. cb2023]|nr:hypothetical protein QZH41_020140 [Actinostola sp. cb2023]
MAVMKDITSYSNIMDGTRVTSASDDNVFVSFTTLRMRQDEQTRTSQQTSRSVRPPLIRLLSEFSDTSEVATSLDRFEEELSDLPSGLLTPTSPNDVEKFSSDCSLSSRPRKKLRIARRDEETLLNQKLQRLSKANLVEIINTLVSQRHPELQQEVFKLIPEPNLQDMETNLKLFKRNIFKSFPYRGSHVGSTRDVCNYRRVHSHIVEFKKMCIDQGKQLLEGCLWKIAVEYVLMAWSHISDLPTWDSPSHNSCKTSCYRTLAVQFQKALTQGSYTMKEYQHLRTR